MPRKVTITLAVEVELTDDSIAPREAGYMLGDRLKAFLFPVGMEVRSTRTTSVREVKS